MNPAETLPALVGVDGVARLYAVSPNTAYSWSARGQLGTPDLRVSNRALWYADRFPPEPDARRLDQIDRGPRPFYPAVLMGPRELSAAFGVQPRTIEQWRRRARDAQAQGDEMPPEPLMVVSLTPIWTAAGWQPYAAAKRKRFVVPSMSLWRREQRALIAGKRPA